MRRPPGPYSSSCASCATGGEVNLRRTERRIVAGTRYFTMIAVAGSLAGSLLMFFLGLVSTYDAFRSVIMYSPDDGNVFGAAAMIGVTGSLDLFLVAIVLLYFAYGVYSLFIHPEQGEEELALPAWLRVTQIGQLKQVVAEMIIVILFVLFLRQALQVFSAVDTPLTWRGVASLAIVPFSTLLLGIALRLVELHPKPLKPAIKSDEQAPPI